MNINLKLSTLIGLALAGTSAHASGPLIISDETGVLKPVVWVTSNGPIPVYTDGGGAFTYDFDGVTPFITNVPRRASIPPTEPATYFASSGTMPNSTNCSCFAMIFPLRYGVTIIGIPPDATKTMGMP